MRPFRDRMEAGRRLAELVEQFRDEDPIVVGLPRGGVPVAAEVARALDAPLDVIVVRKLGVPFQPELGMGAVGEDGVRVLNDDVIAAAHVTREELALVEARERQEVDRRASLFRGDRPPLTLRGRTVIVVDDGIATGGTARAALQVARAHGARRVVLAVPVAPEETLADLRHDADAVICVQVPDSLMAIGFWYDDFSQTSDTEVRSLLAQASARHELATKLDDPRSPRGPVDEEVTVAGGDVALGGHLTIPAYATGLVVFAHGSGSSRHSPRNQFVAHALHDAGLGTLLFDLLTPDEEIDRSNVFDVELLARRLDAATSWLGRRGDTAGLPFGYFGASTGAAAALWAAAAPGSPVRAVVSRGGRPDLAAVRLAEVRAPTVLVVGGYDDVVLELNRDAARRMRCRHEIEVIPRATHLFEEPGALEAVAKIATNWFQTYLPDEPVRD